MEGLRKGSLEQRIKELRDDVIEAMDRLEQLDDLDEEKPLKKRIKIPLPNIEDSVLPSTVEIGKEGEAIAMKLLGTEGYQIVPPSSEMNTFDFLAVKTGETLGVNVKYLTRSKNWKVDRRNLEQMLTFKDAVTPILLFLTKNYAILFKFNSIFFDPPEDPPTRAPADKTKRLEGQNCPRCGRLGSLQIKEVRLGKKVYHYPAVAHYVGTEGKTTRIKWCYLTKDASLMKRKRKKK